MSLGYVSAVKGVEVLIRAFGRLVHELPQARLVLGGPVEKGAERYWAEYVAEHAPGAQVQLTGTLSPQEWDGLVREADLAVQLRLISNGESSGATADCIVAGLPVIVSDLGWFGDLPDDVAEKVPVEISTDHLAERVLKLLRDDARWSGLSDRSRQWATSHSFASAALAYLEALEL